MRILLDNVDFSSTSGPNHFGSKIKKYFKRLGYECGNNLKDPNIQLSFIEIVNRYPDIPIVQRLDGIYFDIGKNNELLNSNIFNSYKSASGVIFQSEYSRQLVTKYFGDYKNSVVIHNGADMDYIEDVEPLKDPEFDKYDNIWCCASKWRGWKRLRENIRYFLEYSNENDCLVVAGTPEPHEFVSNPRVYFVGELDIRTLFSLYKASKYFIHLARYDACPNVVVDASACGCEVICTSLGGTKEVAGPGATVIVEDEWNFELVDVNNPPNLDFSKTTINTINNRVDMQYTSQKYIEFLQGIYDEQFS